MTDMPVPHGIQFGGYVDVTQDAGDLVREAWFCEWRLEPPVWKAYFVGDDEQPIMSLYGVGDTPLESLRTLVAYWTTLNGGVPSRTLRTLTQPGGFWDNFDSEGFPKRHALREAPITEQPLVLA